MMYQDDPRWAATSQTGGVTRWTREEDLRFEQALVGYPDGMADWEAIARQLPGKTAAEVAEHYSDLVHDVEEIDAGRVELPTYTDSASASWDSSEAKGSQISFGGGKSKSDPDRKKGTPWSEEEHRLFLLGLEKFGKGDWRSISRNFVVTRTPTQVASHAQKYYLRQGAVKKERKRSSIHDITSVDAASAPALPPDRNNCFLSLPAAPPPPNNNNPPPLPPPPQQQQMQEFHHQQFHHHRSNMAVPISQVGPVDYQHYGYPM